MTSMAQKVGLVILGGALGSGGTLGLSELSKTRDGGSSSEVEVKDRYTEINPNTFLIAGGGLDQDAGIAFGKNLEQFRKEHSGEFLLISRDPRHPFSSEVLAVRRSEPSKDGEPNTITVDVSGVTGK